MFDSKKQDYYSAITMKGKDWGSFRGCMFDDRSEEVKELMGNTKQFRIYDNDSLSGELIVKKGILQLRGTN